MNPRILFATGNPGKIQMLTTTLSTLRPEWTFEARDPGDAELRAQPGYRSGALAKAQGITPRPGEFVIGHDSGWEFACLDGKPGPLTHRWLQTFRNNEWMKQLEPGSSVRVVHALALLTTNGLEYWEFVDHRTVPTTPTRAPAAGLPLASLIQGEELAFEKCVTEAVNAIDLELSMSPLPPVYEASEQSLQFPDM